MSGYTGTDTASFEDVRCDAETDKALCCYGLADEDGVATWVPKSQIHDDSEVYKPGHSGTLVVSAWWAGKAGLS